MENSLVVLQNIRHRVTINPAILLQDIYPRKMKTNIYTKSCMQMFVVTLFIIIKQNKSNYEWIFKRWYISVMKYYRRGMILIHNTYEPWKS